MMEILLGLLRLPQLVVVLAVILAFAPVLIWAERRQSAMIQDRLGPERANLKLFGKSFRAIGLFHPIADAVKMFWKEDFVPPRADKLLHAIAPILCVVPVLVSVAVIPIAGPVYWDYLTAGSAEIPADAVSVPMQIASVNVGILFLLAVGGTGIVGAAIAGYSSDNKYSLLGGMRAAGQMVSYEVTLGLTLVPAVMVYGSLVLENMIGWQSKYLWGVVPRWGIFFPTLAVSFVLYLAAALAEAKRPPFDVPEGESELVGGYFTEYSSMKFGLFFMSEFIEVVVLAAVATTVFFGGYQVPWLSPEGFAFPKFWAETADTYWVFSLPHGVVILVQILGFVLKLVVLIWLQLMLRWSLPRFRYDQVMRLCWQNMLPIALVNIAATGLMILALPLVRDWFY